MEQSSLEQIYNAVNVILKGREPQPGDDTNRTEPKPEEEEEQDNKPTAQPTISASSGPVGYNAYRFGHHWA